MLDSAVIIIFLIIGAILTWRLSKNVVGLFSLTSIYFITFLWSFNFFGVFQWFFVADCLLLLTLVVYYIVKKTGKKEILFLLGALVYGGTGFWTYLWSEKIFMDKAIKLAADIEKGCMMHGECIRSIPGWRVSAGGGDSRGLSTRWGFFFHKTYVHYRIQPDHKSFYLQEIYQHGRMTTISVAGDSWTISHSGAYIPQFHREGTGRISLADIGR